MPESWQTIAIGVASGLTANVLWGFFRSVAAGGAETLAEFASDVYAYAVKLSFFSEGRESTFYFLLGITLVVSVVVTDGLEQSRLIAFFPSVTAMVGAAFAFLHSTLSILSENRATRLKVRLTKIRSAVSDSVYHNIRSEIAKVTTYGELRSVESRIASQVPED
jgi:hypothetical protein